MPASARCPEAPSHSHTNESPETSTCSNPGNSLQAADFKSVRGSFKFNKNQFPIQDYYLRVVRKDDKGRITNRLMGKILTDHQDSFVSQCKMPA